MTKGVIDVLELVEIEHQDRERLSRPAQTRESFVEFLEKKRAVGETGEQIMPCHESDLRLGPLTVGDIFVRRHPPPARNRPMRNSNASAIVEMPEFRTYGLWSGTVKTIVVRVA